MKHIRRSTDVSRFSSGPIVTTEVGENPLECRREILDFSVLQLLFHPFKMSILACFIIRTLVNVILVMLIYKFKVYFRD